MAAHTHFQGFERTAPNHLPIDDVTAELRQARQDWRQAHARHAEIGTRGFPSRRTLDGIVASIAAALFPLRLGPPELAFDNEDAFVAATLETALNQLGAQVRLNLAYARAYDAVVLEAEVERITAALAAALPFIRRAIDADVQAAYLGDPAAQSVDEVLLCYPCSIAVVHHRIAHELYRLGAPLVARIIAEIANSRTGIDIHPGATIGHSFFIDHGTGVVIGETAIIGDRVRLYQAVTLGAKSFPSEADGTLAKGLPRHPIVESDVIIYAGATILGRVTIGRGSIIGGNVWIVDDVAPYTTVSLRTNAQRNDADVPNP